MKVIEKIQEAAANGRTVFSFEYFPPKTEEGVENLFERMDRMVAHGPNFCDITWGAGGSTADVTLDIANRMQNMVCVETMMHLTCTNMPVEKIDNALDTIKNNGIQNVLALRGDPPHGQDKFVQVAGGFSCALDLVQHIRAKYGDYFGITVAGYPEAHPEVILGEDGATEEAYSKDLAYLKRKVDAGADVIVTQLFYDTDIFLKFVNDCRQIGITCPIVPGIMPINNYKGFVRMTGFCKTKVWCVAVVPSQVMTWRKVSLVCPPPLDSHLPSKHKANGLFGHYIIIRNKITGEKKDMFQWIVPSLSPFCAILTLYQYSMLALDFFGVFHGHLHHILKRDAWEHLKGWIASDTPFSWR